MAARRLAGIAAWVVVLAAMTGCLAELDGPRYRDGAVNEHDAQGVDAAGRDAVQGVDATDTTAPPIDDVPRVDAVDATPPSVDVQRIDVVITVDVPVARDAPPDVAVDAGPCVGDGDCAAMGSACAIPACVSGRCATRPVSCDDGQPCTDDLCVLPGGCLHTPNVLPCDVGMGRCVRGQCGGGTCSVAIPVTCDPSQMCEPTTGDCVCRAGMRMCTSGGPGTCVALTGGCCSDGECPVLQTCQAGHCAACGVLGLLCCASGGCGMGTVCDLLHTPALCQSCGGVTQPCCTGHTCVAGLTCNTSGVCT